MGRRMVAALTALILSVAFAGGAAAEVALASGVTTAKMLEARYWIDRYDKSHATVMTAAQIQTFNGICLEERNGDGEKYVCDMQTAPETMPAEEIAKVIRSCEVPEGDSYLDGALVPENYFADLDAYRNVAALKGEVAVRFAVSVRRLNARAFPTDDFVVSEADDRFYDNLQMAEIMPFAPLMVLHATADGEWLWVRSYAFDGWVHADGVAIFDSRAEWRAAFDCKNFLVVTASRMRLEEDPYCPELSGLELYMGNVLPLADDPPASVNRRATYGSYVVRLPIRGADGKAVVTQALVPVSSDVHIGYLDYTVANCLELAFKLLGERYGWGGLYGANDCSGILGQIFACFGFKFPRNSRAIAALPTFGLDLGEMSNDEKRGRIESLAPGSILYMPGHITLYLGSENGDNFVLSAAGSMLDP